MARHYVQLLFGRSAAVRSSVTLNNHTIKFVGGGSVGGGVVIHDY